MAKRPGSEKLYEVFSKFTDLCIIKSQSLLWPDERCWTLENLEKIKTSFVDNPIYEGRYWDKLKQQFGHLNDECWKVLADAMLIYGLPSTHLTPDKKYSQIKEICDYKNFDLPERDSSFWDVLEKGFVRTTMRYHFKYMQLALIFLFALNAKNVTDPAALMKSPKDVEKMLDESLFSIEQKSDRAWDMRHALLHMAFPENYEHIISTNHKKKIVAKFKDRVPEEHRSKDLEEQLFHIRSSFEKEYPNSYFNFYLPEIKEKWKSTEEDEHIGENSHDNETDKDPFEEDPLLDDLINILWRQKQIILYGPPGTGKSYYAIKIAREIIAQNNFEKSYSELAKSEKEYLDLDQNSGEQELKGSEHESYLYFCTFHPAFGYEEFIEGFRPSPSKKGMPEFILQDGIFKKMCKRARANPNKSFVLIIDEINRGNIPRIFGELITLLEKDKRYIDKDNKGISVMLPASQESFYVPSNVLIVGTMNTADRSIALLDVALRRRFGFHELMPMPELLESREIEGINLGSLLIELNKLISREVGRNLQIGHSYFMEKGTPIKDMGELVNCMRDKIIPLLQEYCYNDYSRLSRILGSSFVDVENQSFKQEIFQSKNREDLINAFKSFTEIDNEVQD